MDKSTRNNIQRATQAGRTLLERAFSDQLAGTFDILLDGTIAEQAGSHLNDRQKIFREKLVATMAHKRSAGMSAQAAVQAYLREAAFTTLNRFVALKMLEARNLVQECISKGEDSSGFKEFSALAPGLVASEDKGYQLYIESLFDEIGQEVKVLFDRRNVASLLWPNRQTLIELLGVLNSPELAGVWAEDETIGWVYQYFNGDDERTQMRKQSSAPRNSRELAVRNQFFTPRYVVKFLTDNTLGRTWYEMMQGETKLADLDLLVHRPNEVFLADGVSAPESEPGNRELNQEELLQQIMYVPFRIKKDPRDLRILDPACGSGHFLLYAFDLLITIYEEAWGDSEAITFTETGTKLQDEYGSLLDLRCAMPDLILRHNLHGVDIDPRAAQIAALALWMRAQRAFNEFDIIRAERPPITKTNIVVAEPMPGDAELVEAFAVSLNPPVLGDLFKKMVNEMNLTGELGSLLKIEESIAEAVTTTRKVFVDRLNTFRSGFLPGFEPAQKEIDFSGIDDESFFDEAEARIIAALKNFAESAAGGAGFRRQLFVGDAAQGIAFIELMRRRFDIVVMNPPFGDNSKGAKKTVDKMYPNSRQDLFAVFVERSIELVPKGYIGVLSTEAGFFRRTLAPWRRMVLLTGSSMSVMGHLGGHVLDGATVRTAAYTLEVPKRETASMFLRLLGQHNKQARLSECISTLNKTGAHSDVFNTPQTEFEKLPYAVFGYWCSNELRNAFINLPNIEGHYGHVRQGLATADDFRFLRLRWEVVPQDIGENRWMPFAKGGEYSPYSDDVHLLLNWAASGNELTAWGKGRPQNIGFFGKPGFSYPRRTNKRFAPRVLPAGCAFGDKGPAIVDVKGSSWSLLAILNSRPVSYLLSMGLGAAEAEGGAGANSYEVGLVQRLPIPARIKTDMILESLARKAWKARADQDLRDETAAYFTSPFAPLYLQTTIDETCSRLISHLRTHAEAYVRTQRNIDERVVELYRFSDSDWKDIQTQAGEVHVPAIPDSEDKAFRREMVQRLLMYLLGASFGRWDVTGLCVEGIDIDSIDPFTAVDVQPGVVRDSSPAILHDDKGHSADILAALKTQLRAAAFDEPETILLEASSHLGLSRDGLRRWIATSLFPYHIRCYSKSRRKAPIYWQLATPLASYSVWCYYNRLSRDTFFRIANDYVTPKVDHEERKLETLRQEAGHDLTSKQRKAIDNQEAFVVELRAFKTEVNRIAPLWNPNHNDGVIINFAPLWRLVPQHKPWQKECKKTWDKLVKGDYDWAHLAMHLWPERVVRKCGDDRSLAIAHELENEFWYEDDDGKWQKRKLSDERIVELVTERSSNAVQAALKDLLEAPAPTGGRTRRKRRTKS